jgi:dihydroneopterin aldolase
MTDDLSTAFDLSARGAALAGPDPLDRISLLGHVVAAEIGAFEQERGVTQRLRFDIVVEVEPRGDAGDDVDRILSYDRLAEAAAAELAAERLALLETLADRVARRILREPQARRVFLRVQKLDRGPGELGVEIVRSRGEGAAVAEEADPLSPRVVSIDAGVDPGPSLDRWGGEPLLLVPRGPAGPVPRAATPEAERRVRLLAFDQAAWVLAARDARLTVTATRTEMDWALRRSHPAVWAPSKIVLDAPGAPRSLRDLADWLAIELRARHRLDVE